MITIENSQLGAIKDEKKKKKKTKKKKRGAN